MSNILAAGAARMKLEAENYEARLAGLVAENERLKRVNNGLHDEVQFMRKATKEARESLSRTGAVKVKALEWTKLSAGWISHTPFHAYEVVATANGFVATYANLDFAWGEEDTMKLAAQADFERRILSALETTPRATNTVEAHETANVSDKPEGQQEPVAWVARIGEVLDEGDGFWRSCSGCHELDEGHPTGDYSAAFRAHVGVGCGECGGLGVIWDDTDYSEMGDYLTRPSEQAVTEAMVERAFRDGVQYGTICEVTDIDEAWRTSAARTALKAAMEAGG